MYVQPDAKKYDHVRTYRRGLECLLAHMYGQGSCTWLGQSGETASSSCSWEGNRMCHVHREATEYVVFIGSQSAWTEQPKQGLAYRRTEETGLLFDRVRSKRDPVHREGLAYHRTEETDLCSTAYGRNGVLLIGRGVAYCKTKETNLCWSAYGRNGVPFIGRGVAYRKTRLHRLLFIHRRLPPASTSYCSSTGSCSSSLHRLLFNQPSMGSCSTSPP